MALRFRFGFLPVFISATGLLLCCKMVNASSVTCSGDGPAHRGLGWGGILPAGLAASASCCLGEHFIAFGKKPELPVPASLASVSAQSQVVYSTFCHGHGNFGLIARAIVKATVANTGMIRP